MSEKRSRKPRRPATTSEGRESQLVSLAIDLAEKQLSEGTASAQVITHYLKMGSEREKLEREKLHGENDLLRARVDNLASLQETEELYARALAAMSLYSGRSDYIDDEP